MNITQTVVTIKVTQYVKGVSFEVSDTYGRDEGLVCKSFGHSVDFDRDGTPHESLSGRGVKRLKSGAEGTGQRIIYSVSRKKVPAEIMAVLDKNVADIVAELGITYTPKEA